MSRSAEAAQTFCKDGPCTQPYEPGTCCIWRLAFNTCPVSPNYTNSEFCAPWLPTNGIIVGYTQPLFGLASRAFWNTTIPAMVLPGKTIIMATFFLGHLKISTTTSIISVLRAVCGDGSCEPNQNETCLSCPEDCGACSLEARVGGAIIAVVFLVFMGAGTIGLFFFRRSRLALWDNSWIVFRDKVTIIEHESQKASHTMIEESTEGAEGEAASKPFVYGKIGDTLVSIKSVERDQVLLTKKLRKEIKTMRQLNHRNVCQLVGICLEPPEIVIYMEYCPKRSLRDVLRNEVMPTSWAFKLSLIHDIVSGVEHLHTHGFIHGRLNTQNCVVDDRLTCKITDFGLECLRYNKPEDKLETFLDDPRNWAFIAPEYRGETVTPPHIRMDSYSYGTIMCEVAQLRELIKFCWSPPETRPSFDVIRMKMELINPRRKNPIDIILSLVSLSPRFNCFRLQFGSAADFKTH
ncbi:unnamed protein product [Mesocestoides corti]|uniref:guanylate cyclase n=1 Tax=Mesocestoides corti TaxID=53468 RepID=A0A158QVN6_MESCO|nr:unnamed protein product [Mesocestoides corti]